MNITKLISLACALAVIAPSVAVAATIGLSPTSFAVDKSATFSVEVSANPSPETAYTVRANLSFDPNLLELVSWSFAPKWLVLSQTGYDVEDNAKGILVKTAGYPGGLTSSTVLGTAVFRAKSVGTATVSVDAASLVLDKASKNLLVGAQGSALITISAPIPAPVQQTQTQNTRTSAPVVSASVGNEPPVDSEAVLSGLEEGSAQSAAAVALADTEGGNTSALLAGLAFVAIIGGGFWAWRRQRGLSSNG